jgi:transcriptional regulator with XRE-family HTH domain
MVLLKEIKNQSLLASYVDKFKSTGDLAFEQAKLKIVDQIVEAMNSEGVNKAELARRLCKSRAYITQILQGDVNFTIESLVRIATTLDCEIEVQLARKYTVGAWIKECYKPVLDDLNEEDITSSVSSSNEVDILHYAQAS